MHIQAKRYLDYIASVLPAYFKSIKVLDVGAGDINGNNRYLFKECEYVGNDVAPNHNVTHVCKTSELPFEDRTFDTIISSECFEHDPEYELSWKKIYNMLKPGGLFVFTCASTGRPEHGTRRTTPRDSFGAIAGVEDMQDYYKNLTHNDLNTVLSLNESFSVWDTYYESEHKDLFFVGIKNGGSTSVSTLPRYPYANHTSAAIV